MFLILSETLIDALKTLPFLFIVYLFLEFVQKKAQTVNITAERFDRFGPLFGALAGCVPQCGFSAAAAALYKERTIRGGVLIAVFLATSDEAIPVLLSQPQSVGLVFALIGCKFLIGLTAGYILNFLVFRHEILNVIQALPLELNSCEDHTHHHQHTPIWRSALSHTLKVALYLLLAMLVINSTMAFLGAERTAQLLLSGSFWQPFVAGLLGLIPGCSVSVLLIELLLQGQLSFGSAIAGLSTGVGFGYLVLFSGGNWRNGLKIVGWTYLFASVTGILINAFAQ